MTPFLEIHLKEPKTLVKMNISTPIFIAALFTITSIWKQHKCPSVDEWIKQLWDIYTMEFYWAIRKKEVLPFVIVMMDLENIMLSGMSQTEKDKYHMVHSYVESNEQTELTSKIETDSYTKSKRTAKRGVD